MTKTKNMDNKKDENYKTVKSKLKNIIKEVLSEIGNTEFLSLTTHSPNFNSIKIGDVELYFSYKTLVIVDTGKEIVKTSEKYSNTTSKQINSVTETTKTASHQELLQLAKDSIKTQV